MTSSSLTLRLRERNVEQTQSLLCLSVRYPRWNIKSLRWIPFKNRYDILLDGRNRLVSIPVQCKYHLAGNMYTGYQDVKDNRVIINGYQEKIDQNFN